MTSPRDATVAVMRLPERARLARADLAEIAAALEAFETDPAVGAVMLRGTAGAFCGGLDLREFGSREGFDELAAALERCFLSFAHLSKPLVVAVDGLACGFGATLLCLADIVIVSQRTRVRMPFLDLGLLPEAGSTLLLAERVGYLNAMRLLGLGEEIGADEAKAIGLATKVATADDVDRCALAAAWRLARRPNDLLSATMGLLKPPRPDLEARVRAEIALCVDRLRRPEVHRRLSRIAAMERRPSQTGRKAA